MASGAGVTLVTNSSGNYIVGAGGSSNSAKIIRTDVLIEGGGVLHVGGCGVETTILQLTGVRTGRGPHHLGQHPRHQHERHQLEQRDHLGSLPGGQGRFARGVLGRCACRGCRDRHLVILDLSFRAASLGYIGLSFHLPPFPSTFIAG